jgi:hypothetical protein
MPGLVLLKPEGNFIEIIVAFIAALLVARVVLLVERGRITTPAPQSVRVAGRR